MRQLFVIMLLSVSVILSAQMKEDADTFLRNIPQTQPADWTDAINLALEGQTELLDSVRNSRNKAPRLPDNVSAETIAPGITLFRNLNGKNSPRPMLVYLHGGGWTVGSINSCTRFCAAVAASDEAIVAALDYPLAPEHPFPAAIEFITDAVKTLRDMADRLGSSPELISIGGDSSGGNLAISTASLLPDEIRSMVLFYPVTLSDTDNSHSWKTFGALPSLDATLMDAFNRAYRPDSLKFNPLVSPLKMADETIARLPRTLMISAERDILLDQAKAFASRLRANGVAADHQIFPSTVHLFITVPGQPAAFEEAVRQTVAHLSQTGKPTRQTHQTPQQPETEIM
ncbi:MAG: alpha/beta hydrolase [Paramuribaculum sp.]|nr:alpha/beta hydrolase [Paramuribaculum sp.]